MRSLRWAVLLAGPLLAVSAMCVGCGSVTVARNADDAFPSALPTGSQIDGDAKWRTAGNHDTTAPVTADAKLAAGR